MDKVNVGDIVICKNAYGKLGKYLVVKINKHHRSFCGLAVVSSLRENQRRDRVVKIDRTHFVILTALHQKLRFVEVEEFYPCMENVEADKLYKRSLKIFKREDQKLDIFSYCREKPRPHDEPSTNPRFCSGGLIRPK